MNKTLFNILLSIISCSFIYISDSPAFARGDDNLKSDSPPTTSDKQSKKKENTGDVLFEKNSMYQYIKVTELKEPGRRYVQNTNRKLKQGGIDLNAPDKLLFEYTQLSFIALPYLNREPKDVLFVGLGAGVMPRYFQRYYPDANIDSVEIAPDIYEVAKKYFLYQNKGNMKVYINDGRIFVKKSKKKYDIIFLDAYQGGHIPFHLTTREYLKEVKRILKDDGIVVSNILAEKKNKFFYSMIKTYMSEFPHLYCFQGVMSDNFIFVTSQSKEKVERINVWFNAHKIQEEKKFDIDIPSMSYMYGYYTDYEKDSEALTDDFAPVNLFKHMTVE
jgi:spermidine synthase